jgi:hypothetical protein
VPAKRERSRSTVCGVWFGGSRQAWPRSTARAEADREEVAVDREIEHRPRRRQPLGERRRVGQVLAAADRDAVATRDRSVERARPEQRFSVHGAGSAGAASRRA